MGKNDYHLPVNEPPSRLGPRGLLRILTRHLTLRRALIGGAMGLSALGLGLTVSFYWPRTMQLQYAAPQTCIVNPTLLPATVTGKQNSAYAARLTPSVSVAGYPLYSHTTCITPTALPKENQATTVQLASRLTPAFKKNVRITAGTFPALATAKPFAKPVSTKGPLVLRLTGTDRVFGYRLRINEQTVRCAEQQGTLSCNLSKLKLAQSATYQAAVERAFKNKPAGVILTQPLTTVEAVSVASSSISPGQTVYDAPGELTLTLNRRAVNVSGVRLTYKTAEAEQEVATTTVLSQTDNTVTIRFNKPLPRSTMLSLAIQSMSAADDGYLVHPFVLTFATSGGPKVLGVSIGTYKVSPAATIALSFDSDVAAAQNISQFVRLESGGNAVPATVSLNGRTITIAPHKAFGGCTPFSVKVLDGLQNTFGISGGSAWQFNSRTICQTVFSIGTSVQGRTITAYRFGSGPSKIVYVGATHGDEKSTTATLNRWIDAIESNPGAVPAHRTIIIIPNLNPDGYAAGRRTNAHNVDLNRNFPASSWKSGVTMPDKSYLEYGGGTAPLSEPESKALADYITTTNPRLVLTYHATGGVVVPNDSGDSQALAGVYDQKSNVYFMSNGLTSTFFEYDTTGAFEDWLHDKPGIPALLIELWTNNSNEFGSHYNAMWYMAQL